MKPAEFPPTVSRNILILLLTTLGALILTAWLTRDELTRFYFDQGLTSVGLLINGAIFLLFLAGLARIATQLWRYYREEVSVRAFLKWASKEPALPAKKLPRKHSLISQRFQLMANSHAQGITPNHAALAEILVTNESLKGSLPRYINNILILAGVFGTIVSLSIALLGTSTLLSAPGSDSSGIDQVIHGMSTALSTTATAIVCYVVFGYFYLRLNLARSRLLSAIEQITLTLLMPKFRVTADNMAEEVATLVDSLKRVARQMHHAQLAQAQNEADFKHSITLHAAKIDDVTERLDTLAALTRKGFRLPAEPTL